MITSRPDTILCELPSLPKSKNLHEAKFNSIRLYRRACQLMPSILKYHRLEDKITPEDAMNNLMKAFYANRHHRIPLLIDYLVVDGYQMLYDAQFKYSDVHHFEHLIIPQEFESNSIGKSLLNQENNKKRSNFASSFYSK